MPVVLNDLWRLAKTLGNEETEYSGTFSEAAHKPFTPVARDNKSIIYVPIIYAGYVYVSEKARTKIQLLATEILDIAPVMKLSAQQETRANNHHTCQ